MVVCILDKKLFQTQFFYYLKWEKQPKIGPSMAYWLNIMIKQEY